MIENEFFQTFYLTLSPSSYFKIMLLFFKRNGNPDVGKRERTRLVARDFSVSPRLLFPPLRPSPEESFSRTSVLF